MSAIPPLYGVGEHIEHIEYIENPIESLQNRIESLQNRIKIGAQATGAGYQGVLSGCIALYLLSFLPPVSNPILSTALLVFKCLLALRIWNGLGLLTDGIKYLSRSSC